MRGGMIALASCVLVCAPSAAQDEGPTSATLTERMAQVGTWDFQSRGHPPDAQPLCKEIWTFRADGTATVVSGQQTVEKTWRAAVDGDGLQWLYTTSISATAGPDCTGKVDDPASFPRPENSFVLLFLNGGMAVTCQAPRWIDGPQGKPIQRWEDDQCWGSIAPRTEN